MATLNPMIGSLQSSGEIAIELGQPIEKVEAAIRVLKTQPVTREYGLPKFSTGSANAIAEHLKEQR